MKPFCHLGKKQLTARHLREIKKGEEIFNDYVHDFVKCDWYDNFQMRHRNIPISMMGHEINTAIEAGLS